MSSNRQIDTIVYLAISKGGGVDGLDHTDKGGNITDVFLSREAAEKRPNASWSIIKPEVFDLAKVAEATLKKLDPVERLALAPHYGCKPPIYRGGSGRITT